MQSQARRNQTYLSTQHKQEIRGTSEEGSLWTDGKCKKVGRDSQESLTRSDPQGSKSKLARDVLPVARHWTSMAPIIGHLYLR